MVAPNTAAALGPGGFLPPTLPSPAPSNVSSRTTGNLPHPRAHALRPGSRKEDTVRQYVEERFMKISRRYVKKFGSSAPGDDIVGYRSMAELCRDVEEVVDIVWLSGTPSLQIPYLLNIAGEFATWAGAFPASPVATFSVLGKLDHCFASLIMGEDIDTRETLPGFENGLRAGMSSTDMVRCKSVVEQMRIVAVEIMKSSHVDEDDEDYRRGQLLTESESSADEGAPSFQWRGLDDEDDDSDEAEDGRKDDGDDGDDDDFQMDVARVYENTLVRLGEVLGGGGGIGDL